MNGKLVYKSSRRLLLASLGLMLCGSAPALAAIILNVQSVAVTAGSTNDAFEVTLINTGTVVTVDSFSFGLSVAGTAITFQQATTATTPGPYIFAGNSAFGPVINTTPPPTGQTLIASDLYGGAGNGVTIATGAIVGLGEVSFNVAANAVGPYIVSFIPVDTSLSDINGTAIPITTENSGTITITTSTVPEPSTWLLLSLGALPLLLSKSRLRRA